MYNLAYHLLNDDINLKLIRLGMKANKQSLGYHLG